MVKALGSFERGDMSDLALEPLPTATERAADLIRDNIFEGRFAPGTPLPEAALSSALHVSRNTVREAFRILIGEHLLTHEARKGVVVRKLSADDVRDITTVLEEAYDVLKDASRRERYRRAIEGAPTS